MKQNWKEAYTSAQGIIEEEIISLDKLIDDDDSSCPVRELRRARRDGLQFALATLAIMETWELG